MARVSVLVALLLLVAGCGEFYVRDVGPVLAVSVQGDTGGEELVDHTTR